MARTGKRQLTRNQVYVIESLIKKGAGFTAAAVEEHWRNGQTYYLDQRNSARRGLIRAFERGNREATS